MKLILVLLSSLHVYPFFFMYFHENFLIIKKRKDNCNNIVDKIYIESIFRKKKSTFMYLQFQNVVFLKGFSNF